MRQSFCWWCFKGRGVEDMKLLAAAREIGFDAVELLPANLLPAARDVGLSIASHVGHNSIPSGLNDPKNHARILAEVQSNLELAVKFGVRNLIVFSGNRRSDLSEEEGQRITADALARLAPLAEQAGVNLVLELLNSKIDHAGYQCDRSAWGVAVCERVNSRRVKLLYDVYHMQVMEGDLIRTIRAHHRHIGHYHIAGCPARDDPDPSQEIHYPAVLAAISSIGYDGYIGHEFLPKQEPLTALEQAHRLVLSSHPRAT
jgi:hydroxypyruvate isomerase